MSSVKVKTPFLKASKLAYYSHWCLIFQHNSLVLLNTYYSQNYARNGQASANQGFLQPAKAAAMCMAARGESTHLPLSRLFC